MVRSQLVAATAALLLCLVGQVSAQVPVNITAFSVTPVTAYGSPLTYTISLATPAGQPVPTSGSIAFINSTTTSGVGLPPPLIVFNLQAGVIVSGCQGTTCVTTVTFTDTGSGSGVTLGGGKLSAGLYNAVSVAFGNGAAAGNVTFSSASSVPSLPLRAFQVLPASVEFRTAFTPFTLANFSSAISVNLTNLNLTSVVPAGSAYAAFYKDPAGANTLIGNYSLVFTPVDANTVKLTFPSNFNAATLFTTTGPYRLIETYYPTPNFTQPQPLVIGFTVTTTAPPPPPPPGPPVNAPPPPPLSPPPPPSPPSGGQKTTIALSIFFNYAKRRALLSEPSEEIAMMAAAPGAEFSAAAAPAADISAAGPAAALSAAVAAGPAAELSSLGYSEGSYGGGYAGCSSGSGSLTFVAAVSGTNGVPADGTVTFTLAPSSTPLGVVPVVATAGSAVAKLTVPVDGATYGYGAHAATAVYSGSTNGAFLPAQVTVAFVIPNCQQVNAKDAKINHIIDTVQGILISDSSNVANNGYPVQVAGK
ncbi:g5461 [Coccomyxa elongata]